MSAQRPAVLVATLGTRPQVVTIALDLLLDQGAPIQEVVIIHTASTPRRPDRPPPARDWMAESLEAIRRQFPARSQYLHHGRTPHPCRFKMLQLVVDGRPIDDVHDDEEARAVFNAIFDEVQRLKKQRHAIHLSIAGGRKSMSVYGMAVAQLLFDSNDRLWHLFSSAEFEALNLLHPRDLDDAHLVRIPTLPISSVFPGMVTLLTSRDPLRVLERKQAVMAMEEQRSRREFLHSLSADERQIVDLLMNTLVIDNRALSTSEIHRKLLPLTAAMVRRRFSAIYDKLRDYLGLPAEEQVDRNVLVYFLTPYYMDQM